MVLPTVLSRPDDNFQHFVNLYSIKTNSSNSHNAIAVVSGSSLGCPVILHEQQTRMDYLELFKSVFWSEYNKAWTQWHTWGNEGADIHFGTNILNSDTTLNVCT